MMRMGGRRAIVEVAGKVDKHQVTATVNGSTQLPTIVNFGPSYWTAVTWTMHNIGQQQLTGKKSFWTNGTVVLA